MKSRDALDLLKEIIGDNLYSEVLTSLSGVTVYFPSNFEWQDKMSRNVSLKEDYYSGDYEIGDLARKYNLSISRVYKIIQHRD